MAPFGKEPPAPAVPARTASAVTLIARESRFVGELTGTRGVRVEGTLKGSVDLKAAFEVVDGAEVEGEVHATTVRIGGTLVGNVTASELVELQASAVVKGDITAPSIHVVEGAKLEGRVQMRTDTRTASSSAPAQTLKSTE